MNIELFSRRKGLIPLKMEQKEYLDYETKNQIENALSDFYSGIQLNVKWVVLEFIHRRHFKLPISKQDTCWKEINIVVQGDSYSAIFDIIELMLYLTIEAMKVIKNGECSEPWITKKSINLYENISQGDKKQCIDSMTESCNDFFTEINNIFKRENVGYRIIKNSKLIDIILH